jgi:uncharacterized protein (DUF697 family)
MQNVVYVVGDNKSFSEYSDRLVQLIKKKGDEVKPLTFEEYQSMVSLADTVFGGDKFIFVGTHSTMPVISNFEYKRFGCYIGWEGSYCIIFALDTDLPFTDYKDFREDCAGLQIEHPDVVVPPEYLFDEAIEAFKKFFTENNQSAHRAQYITIIHEFMGNYFDKFINNDNAQDIKTALKEEKNKALANLTQYQKLRCHVIIHTAAIASAAVAFIPIPFADAIPITSAQIAMVIGLGKVFNNKITKSDAEILLKTAAAPLVGRALAKNALALIPGIGWTINGVIAGTITEILGWSIASYFAKKNLKG